MLDNRFRQCDVEFGSTSVVNTPKGIFADADKLNMKQEGYIMTNYAKKAKGMSRSELYYALADINKTLLIHRNKPLSDPYVKKLYSEFDAYVCELQKR